MDLGNVHPNDIGAEGNPIGGGMELRSLSALNAKIMAEIRSSSTDDIAKKYTNEMKGPWPMYVKDPRYAITWPVWEHANIRPLHVFICIRNPEDIDASIKETTNWNMQNPYILYRYIYGCLEYLLRNDIPYTFIHYPRIAKDRAYTEEILAPYMDDPWSIVQNTWDNMLHHFASTSHTSDSVA